MVRAIPDSRANLFTKLSTADRVRVFPEGLTGLEIEDVVVRAFPDNLVAQPKEGRGERDIMSATLKPLRYPQGDLFVCELTDVILKDDIASMEYPFYSITKRPNRDAIRVERNNRWIEIRPSVKGRPTIYDKDLIIYIISQVAAATEKGDPVPEEIEFDPYTFLLWTQRSTGGRDYEALCDMIERLDGTRYRTNVTTGGVKNDSWFGMLDRVDLKTDEKTGRPYKVTVTVSKWLAEAIKERDLLTLNPNYFRLRRPMERRLYEICRKICGRQERFPGIGLEKLKELLGSNIKTIRDLRRAIVDIVRSHQDADGFPDYHLRFEDDVLRMTPKAEFLAKLLPPGPGRDVRLPRHAHEDARKILEGWCPRDVEDKWRAWISKEEITVKSPLDHYLEFCRAYRRKRGAV